MLLNPPNFGFDTPCPITYLGNMAVPTDWGAEQKSLLGNGARVCCVLKLVKINRQAYTLE